MIQQWLGRMIDGRSWMMKKLSSSTQMQVPAVTKQGILGMMNALRLLDVHCALWRENMETQEKKLSNVDECELGKEQWN